MCLGALCEVSEYVYKDALDKLCGEEPSQDPMVVLRYVYACSVRGGGDEEHM